MKLLRLKVKVKSSFATFPKGNILFGHFANYLFLKGDKSLENYLKEEPKIIFSDFLPYDYVPRPALALDYFGVEPTNKKTFRKKNWLKLEKLAQGKIKESENKDEKACEEIAFFKEGLSTKNALNRKTFTTDDNFPPYSLEEITFTYQACFYVLYDENTFKDEAELIRMINEVGKSGFGKKSSIGKGYFEVEKDEDFKKFEEVEAKDGKYYYLTISPFLPKKDEIQNLSYETYNIFGKFSNSKNPFKKAVLMANSAAVVELDKKAEYIGRALNNSYSKEDKEASFLQAYSILVPFKFDGFKNDEDTKGENNDA